MKHFLMVFMAFVSPLLPLALLISLFSVLDMVVGIWYSKHIGEKITSRKARIGFTRKMVGYFLVLITTYLVDQFIVNEITRNYLWFDFALTKFFTSLLIYIEYMSMDEKIRWIKGKGITDRVIEFGKAIKKVIFFIKDVDPKN